MKSADHLIVGGPALRAWPLNGRSTLAARLQPGKGGGGDGGAGAAREQEEQRQARIRSAVDTINSVFNGGGRDSLYSDQQQAVTQLNQQDLDRQFQENERANRFGLARAGLSGGSVDVDSNAELGRIHSEGSMKSVGLGQAAASDLRTQDERTRQNLISMAQSGIDTGQAAQLALSGMDANASAANAARSGATIGNLFGDLANVYAYNQQQRAFAQGMAPYQNSAGQYATSTRNTYSGVGG